MNLLIATRNRHKTEEIRAILGSRFQVTDLTAHPEIPEIEETGVTFAENAAIKALAASRLFPGLVLADDSGLEVDALGGAPGVRSARYAGDHADDSANRAKLLEELHRFAKPATFSARFRCAIVLAQRDAIEATFEGKVEGTIITVNRGSSGFGYDSLFVPEGYQKTFAELPADVKNRLSHRGRAMAAALEYLKPTQ